MGKVPILAMKAGNDLQTYVDILVPNHGKLTLIKGEGPIHLIGSHCIDFFDNMAGEADFEGEDEEMEDLQEKGKTKDVPASPIKTKSSPVPLSRVLSRPALLSDVKHNSHSAVQYFS